MAKQGPLTSRETAAAALVALLQYSFWCYEMSSFFARCKQPCRQPLKCLYDRPRRDILLSKLAHYPTYFLFPFQFIYTHETYLSCRYLRFWQKWVINITELSMQILIFWQNSRPPKAKNGLILKHRWNQKINIVSFCPTSTREKETFVK